MTEKTRFSIISCALVTLLTAGCGPKTLQSKIDSGTQAAASISEDDATDIGHAQFPWIADDWPQAKALAAQKGVPVLIDIWALWCHSCLSMKHVVLTDPRLKVYKDRFVWLEIDTEKEVNEPLLEIFAIVHWPTFLVVDPANNAVMGLQVGSATVDEFAQFLTNGEAAYIAATETNSAGNKWLAHKVAGDNATIAQDHKTAVAQYQEALANIPPSHKSRPGIVVTLMSNLVNNEDWPACITLASQEAREIPLGTSTEFFSYLALECASHLEPDDARRIELLATTERMLTGLVDDNNFDIAVDDRATAMMTLREILDIQGKHDKALLVAEAQRTLLDKAAHSAATPQEAATYNWPRVEVYIYLDQAELLVPDLEKSIVALPGNYDPPYRLARLYFHMKDFEKSLSYATAAAELTEGARKCVVLAYVANVHQAMGADYLELSARRKTIETCEGLPEGQKRPRIKSLIESQHKLVSETSPAN